MLTFCRCHCSKGWARSIQLRKKQHGPGEALQSDLHGRSSMYNQIGANSLVTNVLLDAKP